METLVEALLSQSSVSEEGKGGESGSVGQENSAAGRLSSDSGSGVIPEIVLASTTKGRFASLVR